MQHLCVYFLATARDFLFGVAFHKKNFFHANGAMKRV